MKLRRASGFATHNRRLLGLLVVLFVVLFAFSVTLSVRATNESKGQTRVAEVASRQRTLIERYVGDIALRRAGGRTDVEGIGQALQLSADALVNGGLAPAIPGDDDEVDLPPATNTAARRELVQAARLMDDLVAQGTAITRHQSADVALYGGEHITVTDPMARLRVIAALASNTSLGAAQAVGLESESSLDRISEYTVALGGVSLGGSLLLTAAIISVVRRQNRTAFRQLFSDNPQPMFVYNAHTLEILDANRSATLHYAMTRDHLCALGFNDLEADADAEPVTRETRSGADQHRHTIGDGRCIDVEIQTSPMRFERKDAILAAVRDVTERNALESELRHRAFHDSLTDLANRALLADRVEHALARLDRSRLTSALIVIDLDDFKTVNDSMGHSAGDELLAAVADRMSGTLRAGSTIARLGGDEFAILLEDLDHAGEACVAAERLLDGLTAPFDIGGRTINVRASIGIAAAGIDGSTFDELLRNADTAMYQAKCDGNSYRVFESEMHRAAVDRLQLESELYTALAEGQIVVYYQPIVAAHDQHVTGVEALVRWEHPTRGLLAPFDFLPIAESSDLIIRIGERVLAEACRQTQWWRTNGHPELGVAVNVAARQLADPTLRATVLQTLELSGLPPAALTLEVTESSLIQNTASAVVQLRELKELGVRIAIDDFGTGYSSLSQLQNLPVDILKIDKSFTDRLTDGAGGDTIIGTILNLAATLDLDTVAEGVEHQHQASQLRALGCSKLQGFTFSRPVAPDEVRFEFGAAIAASVP